jgi:hypothetical protein
MPGASTSTLAADIGTAVAQARATFRSARLPALCHRRRRWPAVVAWSLASLVPNAWAQRRAIAGLAVHGAAVPLGVILFLFVTDDVWSFFGTMDTVRFAGTFALFVAGTLGAIGVAAEDRLSPTFRLSTLAGSSQLAELARRTEPGPELVRRIGRVPEYRRDNTRYRLSRCEQWNIRFVLLAPIFALALAVWLFWFVSFVLLGIVGIDPGLSSELTGAQSPPDVHGLVVSAALLKVSAVLALLAALVYAVESLRDRTLTAKLLGPGCEQMSTWIAMWVYCQTADGDRRRTRPRRPGRRVARPVGPPAPVRA